MAGLLSGRPKLLNVTGYASGERAQLAIAIAAHKTAIEHSAKLEAAVEELEAKRRHHRDVKYNADAAIEHSIAKGPAHAVAMITGQPWEDEPVFPVKDIRAQREEAEAAEHEARDAIELLRPQAERAAGSVHFALQRSLEAARAVLRVEAAQTAVDIAANVLRLRADLAAQSALLRWMVANGAIPTVAEGNQRCEPVDEQVRYAAQGRQLEHLDIKQAPSCAPWREALARLVLDAEAPLPGVR